MRCTDLNKSSKCRRRGHCCRGFRGIRGRTGFTGPTGIQGLTGPQGEPGTSASTGSTGPTGPSTGNVFVFQPGGVQSANVFTDWNNLMMEVSTIEGPKIIQMDDEFVSPVVVPSGVYNLENVVIEGRVFTRDGGAETTNVNLDDGCVFNNIAHFRYNLQIRSLSANPIINLEVGENSRLLLEENVQFISAGGSPFIHAMNNTRINIYDSQFRRNAVGGNDVVVEYDDPTNSSIRLFGRSRLRVNTVRTNIVLDLDIECFSTSATIGNQPQIMGGTNIVLLNNSEKSSYDNTVSGLTSVEVQAAIDELAARPIGVTATPPSTDNSIARWDGGGSTTIQGSLASVDDLGNITGDNIFRGLSNPNISGPMGEDPGDIFQRFSTTRAGFYMNNGNDRWLKLNAMSPIVFNPTDMVNTVDTPTIITRNERSALRFPDPTAVPSTQTTAIFQSVMPYNYSFQDANVKIYFATTTANTGTIGFNVQFERMYPANVGSTIVAAPMGADTNIPIGMLIPEPDGSTTPGVISGEGEGYFIGNGTTPFTFAGLAPAPSGGDILAYTTTLSKTLRMNSIEPNDAFRLRIQRKNSGDSVADNVDVFMVQVTELDP